MGISFSKQGWQSKAGKASKRGEQNKVTTGSPKTSLLKGQTISNCRY
jgi:hypothetical protein